MDKVDRIIDIIRNLKEEMAGGGGMMTTGSSGGTAGFSGSADPKGPVAGYDKPLGSMRKRGIIGKGKFSGARTRWRKGLK
jgi:hypothetical protein